MRPDGVQREPVASATKPLAAGFRMPAEWEPHERCWMAWPSRADLWGESLPETQLAYARIAQAIAAFEPVTMIASPEAHAAAASLCGPQVDTLAIPIDDAWLRDTGPAFLVRNDGARAASAWHFNAWGQSFDRFEEDAKLAGRLCDHLDVPLHQAGLRLEGGAIATDGEGTILTTESCALNPNRNPGMSRADVEHELCQALGASKVIWLPGELSEGDCTDGHIDGLACFARPGLVLCETATDPSSERSKVLQENRRVLERATDACGRALEIVEMEDAWRAEQQGDSFCISYVNFYVANGGIVMPAYDAPGDAAALRIVERAFPDRSVVQVDVRKIAINGGGIHCITQQQPA
jgi:agmatine deiminase